MLILKSINDERLPQLLQSGAVGVLPTDTIYGLVAMASNAQAVDRLYRLKDRHAKPGTIVAAFVEQLVNLGLDATTLRPLADLWPNPLSIVVPAPKSLSYLDQDLGSLAVRIPASQELRALLTFTGPLLTTSVNHPGQPAASSLGEAQVPFGDRLDFYVDGGNLGNRPPSTVVELLPSGKLRVLRPGAFKLAKKWEAK